MSLARLEKTFLERLRLEAPATYWRNRVWWQTGIAGAAFALFLSVGGSPIVIGFYHRTELLEFVTSLSKDFELVPIAVLALPVVFLLWILRLISRVYVNSLSAARDASHRRKMVETYLALVKEPDAGMTEHDRLLILQALFRPEHPAAEDDAPPPNLLEIMAKSLRPK